MNMNSHPATALLVLLAVVLFGASSRAELPEDPKELIKLLKAKDARFDNVHVYYIRRGEYAPEPFPYWKFPGQKPSKEPEKPLSFQFKEQVMLRGRDTTFERDVYTENAESSTSKFANTARFSTDEGQGRNLPEFSRKLESARANPALYWLEIARRPNRWWDDPWGPTWSVSSIH